MTQSFEAAFRRLVAAPPDARAAAARALLSRDEEWPAWMSVFNELYVKAPEKEAGAAQVLAAEAGRMRRPVEAARFRLLIARAVQRAGSPSEAVRAYRSAARALERVGDAVRTAQAQVLMVDALAVAGRIGEALEVAADVEPRLRGSALKGWRDVLRINRANALRLRGDLRDAISEYDKAARGLEKIGQVHTASIARTNAGVAWMDAGNASAARRRFEEAIRGFEKAGLSDMAMEVRYNLAGALARGGDLGESIRMLDRLEREHRERGMLRRAALCAMDLADALLRAGDHPAAERKALAAAEDFARSGSRAERVEALWVAASATTPVDPRRAATHLARAHAAAKRTGRPGLAMRCELLREDLRIRGGKPPRGDVAGLERRARKAGQEDVALQCKLLRGHAALRRRRWTEAAKHFRDPALRRPGRPWIRVAAQTGLAMAHEGTGELGAAIRRLRDAAGFADAVRSGLPGAWLRAAFLLAQLDPYLARVDLLLRRGRPQDRREAESLLDALAARRFLERATPGRQPQARLDKARARLEELYDRIGRGAGPTRGLDVRSLRELEEEAARLERSVAEQWRADERRGHPSMRVDTARPQPCPLPVHVSALLLWLQGGQVRGLVRHGKDVPRLTDLGSADGLAAEARMLAFHERRLRHTDQAASALERQLAKLREIVVDRLGPLEWREEVRLVLDPAVPDLPWELLVLDAVSGEAGRRVLRVPALRLRRRVQPSARGLTVVALGDPDLPGVGRETAGFGGQAQLLTNAGATKQGVVDALQTSDIVHLAGHGFEAAEAPGLAGVRLADGWFGATDVPERIKARLVVLAACRTGRESGPASMAWGGLPHALLAAGAEHVIWTADDVEDEITADLMRRFHTHHEHLDPARSLSRALDSVRRDRGHVGGLLPFRVSGIPA